TFTGFTETAEVNGATQTRPLCGSDEVFRRLPVTPLKPSPPPCHGMDEVVGRVDTSQCCADAARFEQVRDHRFNPRRKRYIRTANEAADPESLLQQCLYQPAPDKPCGPGDQDG